MNKYQKEYLQKNIQDEKEMLKKLQELYEEALKDIDRKVQKLMLTINEDTLQSKIYQIKYQLALKKQIKESLANINDYDTIYEYLEKCYEVGYVGALYDIQKQGIPIIGPIDQTQVVSAIVNDTKLKDGLYKRLGYDRKILIETINKEIARGITTSLTYSEVKRNIHEKTNLSIKKSYLIARTEGHRVMCTATYNAQRVAKENGCDIYKQWDSALDNRTRPSHRIVDGEIREMDEKFSNGLLYPGDPNGSASEVCNCRCALLQRAKWALTKKELDTLKERAEFFGLDKTDNFEDFKNKFLNTQNKLSVADIKKPIRPNKTNFNSYDDYLNARSKYRKEVEKYNSSIDEVVKKAINEKSVFNSKEQVIEWTNKMGITIDKEVLDVIDLKSFNEVKPTLEEMFSRFPKIKSNEFEYFDGKKYKFTFNIGLDDDGFMSANGGFNFNKKYFGNYEQALRTAFDNITTDFNVRGDGTFSTLVRHEFGHDVDSYIRRTIADKYHYNVEDWRNNFSSLDEKLDSDKQYLKELHQYQSELKSLEKLQGISEYSLTNEMELFAEGFAEYTSDGKTEFGIEFGKFLERWLK